MYDRKKFVRPKMSWMCLFFVVEVSAKRKRDKDEVEHVDKESK